MRMIVVSALLMNAATAALAQDGEVSAGVALTSNYIYEGFTQSDDHPALQFYLETESSGFYAGVWGSTVDLDDDSLELDLYLGYRNELANGFSYDASYTRYYYNSTGDCCGDLKLEMGYGVGDTVALSAALFTNFEDEGEGYALGLEYGVNDALSISANYGDRYSAFWDVGASYSVNDNVSLDLRYHDAADGDGNVALTLSFDTTLAGQ